MAGDINRNNKSNKKANYDADDITDGQKCTKKKKKERKKRRMDGEL